MKSDPIQEAAGRRMRACMVAAELRVGQVAKELGVQPQTVHAWFAGKRRVKPAERQKLAALFKVTEQAFYEERGSKMSDPERRQLLTEAAAAILDMFSQSGGGEPPRFLELPSGDSIPVPELSAAEWQRQWGLIEPVLNELAGGDWRALLQTDRPVLVERLTQFALRNIDHKRREATE